VEGAFVCNPSQLLQEKSDLNLFLVGRKIVPGTEGRAYDVNLVMLEGALNEVAEDLVVDAINFGLDALRPVIDLQDRMRAEAGKTKRPVVIPAVDELLVAKVTDWPFPGSRQAMAWPASAALFETDEVRKAVIQKLTAENRRSNRRSPRSSSLWSGASSGR
jgi:polyribonucleotide nucleotidyltransferase